MRQGSSPGSTAHPVDLIKAIENRVGHRSRARLRGRSSRGVRDAGGSGHAGGSGQDGPGGACTGRATRLRVLAHRVVPALRVDCDVKPSEQDCMLAVVRIALLALAMGSMGCAEPGRIQYDGGRCLDGGRPLTAQQVESEQADVARHIAGLQPWFAFITIGVVVVAMASNVEPALLLFRGRHAGGHRSLADRLRDLLARQRRSPALFAALVGGSLGLVAIGSAFYVYLDIDKRASERALGMLQFCHLALRTESEQRVLDEQRHNLQAIESTAGDIRTLVGNLPPDQQQKARLIVSQMNAALDRQDKIVADYATHADEAQKDLSARTVAMEKGLESMEGDLAGLRSLPTSVKDLEIATGRIDRETMAIDERFDDLRAGVTSVEAKMDALIARPACTPAADAPPPRGASSASSTKTQHVDSAAAAKERDGGAAHASKLAPTME